MNLTRLLLTPAVLAAFFLAITPWPYADIAKELDSRVTTRNYRKYNLVEPIVKPDAMEIDELRKAMHRCAGEFFHDKFKRLDEMTPQKKTFMVEVLKVLVEHSYLSHDMHKMASGGEMPAAIKAMLATLKRTPPAASTKSAEATEAALPLAGSALVG